MDFLPVIPIIVLHCNYCSNTHNRSSINICMPIQKMYTSRGLAAISHAHVQTISDKVRNTTRQQHLSPTQAGVCIIPFICSLTLDIMHEDIILDAIIMHEILRINYVSSNKHTFTKICSEFPQDF